MPALERVLELHHPPTRLLQCLARLEQLELRAPERLVNESGHRDRIAEPAEPTTFGRRGDTRRLGRIVSGHVIHGPTLPSRPHRETRGPSRGEPTRRHMTNVEYLRHDRRGLGPSPRLSPSPEPGPEVEQRLDARPSRTPRRRGRARRTAP